MLGHSAGRSRSGKRARTASYTWREVLGDRPDRVLGEGRALLRRDVDLAVEVRLVEVDAEEVAERREGVGGRRAARRSRRRRPRAGTPARARTSSRRSGCGRRTSRARASAGPGPPAARGSTPLRRRSIRAADQIRSTGSRIRYTAAGRTPRASNPSRIVASRSTDRPAYPGVMSAVSRVAGGPQQPGEVVEVRLRVGAGSARRARLRPRAVAADPLTGEPARRQVEAVPDVVLLAETQGRTAARPRGSGASTRSRPSGSRRRAGRSPAVTA